ncbi:MAG: ABC-2 family transporter protein [Planctomycetota bacterium]
MRQIVRAYLAYLRAGIGVMFQYRGEIVLWAVWGLVNPLVLYSMWSSAAESDPGGQIAGYTRGGFAAYFFLVMIVGHFTTAWDVYEMSYMVRKGTLSSMLLRPLMPIWKSLADNTAYKVTTLLFVVPMWCLIAWLIKPEFATTPWHLAVGSVALLLAAALSFFLGYLVSLASFWATKLDMLGEVYFAFAFYLGGRFAPLETLPPPVEAVARALPFRWMYAFPVEVLTGQTTSLAAAASGIGVQVVWLAGVVIAFRSLWSAAVKRYTAVSG